MSDVKKVMPAFVFDRRRDIELECGFVLAGTLFVDLSKRTKPKRRDQQMIESIILQLTDMAQSGRMPKAGGPIIGWPGDCKPANAVDTHDDVLMAAWAKDCVTIAVRVDPRRDGGMRLDSDMRRQLRMIRDH
jgi:hypothetical protein